MSTFSKGQHGSSRLAQAFAPLKSWYRSRWGAKKYGIREPIIVYQMGKVGSRAIYRTLLTMDLDVPVYHSHRLQGLEAAEQAMRGNAGREDLDKHLGKLEEEKELRALVRKNPHRRWTLISGVRHPIEQSVSAYFQIDIVRLSRVAEQYARGEVSLEPVVEQFIAERCQTIPRDWFDAQVKPVFGLDVYATPFPREQGYAIYENARARMLVIRCEDLDRQITTAMRDLLRLEHFVLGRYNRSTDKAYGALYNDFLHRAKLPPAWMDAMFDAPVTRHFYTEAERAAMRQEWIER